jgi:hypothetical protein
MRKISLSLNDRSPLPVPAPSPLEGLPGDAPPSDESEMRRRPPRILFGRGLGDGSFAGGAFASIELNISLAMWGFECDIRELPAFDSRCFGVTIGVPPNRRRTAAGVLGSRTELALGVEDAEARLRPRPTTSTREARRLRRLTETGAAAAFPVGTVAIAFHDVAK